MSTGTVIITTQHAKNTLAVPTSAVTTNGTTSSVEVLDGNTPRQVTVKVGVVGYTWTQITSGLTKGDQVVLASMSKPLPGSATSIEVHHVHQYTVRRRLARVWPRRRRWAESRLIPCFTVSNPNTRYRE